MEIKNSKIMRQWFVNPKLMCRQHLLGEHCEIHMFIGSMKKQINMNGYISKDLLEPKSLINSRSCIAASTI